VRRPSWSRIVCGLIVALSMVRPLGAQRRSAVQVGVSAMRFPEDTTRTFGPFASWQISNNTPHYLLSASAAGVFAPAGETGSAELGAALRTGIGAGWVTEGTAEIDAIVGPGSRMATSAIGAARLLRVIGNGGGWLRVGGNLASREAGLLGGEGVDVGAWWRWPRVQLTTSLGQQWNLAQLFVGPSRGFVVGTVPVRYTEAAAGLHVEGDESSLDVAAALRRDRGAPQLYAAAVSATAALWQSPTRAIVVAVARQLPDFIRGADALDYLSVGLRFNEPTPRASRDARMKPIVRVSESGATREIRVYAPGARTVELRGDFTGWETIRLAPRDGSFMVSVPLSPGSHRVVVRVDGGAWKPAGNTPAVDDDFGGRVGLLLVP
jgi:hypothetical protein